MKLGRHGAVTAEQARTLAIQVLAEVAKGNDPLEDRNSARKAIQMQRGSQRNRSVSQPRDGE